MLHSDDEHLSDRDVNELHTKGATRQRTQFGHEVVADLQPSMVVARDGTLAWEMPHNVVRETGFKSDEIAVGERLIQAADDVAVRRNSHVRIVSASPARAVVDRPADDGAVKLKLDLHDIYNRGQDIDRALRAVIDEAVAKKAPLVEIIPGKGSGALKKHVLRFLDQKEIKALYHRVEKDSDNFGRVFVHFRWK